MKGGNAMNQQELRDAIKRSEEMRAEAMKMAEDSNALMDTDFKKSMEMFLEAMELWSKGVDVQNKAFDEAFASGLIELYAKE